VNQLTNHTNIMKSKLILLFGMFSALVLACGSACAQAAAAPRETVTPAFAHPISNVPGKTMSALVVSYAPGGKTPAHRHGRSFVVGYVLEGAIRSRLDNGEERIYRAGESWTEKPGTRHSSSENASATEPAKMIAVFVAKTDAKDLFTLDAGAQTKK
jgi:quercetin dioxygenase-like cupin family protein